MATKAVHRKVEQQVEKPVRRVLDEELAGQGPMHVAYWLSVVIGSFLVALLALVLVAG